MTNPYFANMVINVAAIAMAFLALIFADEKRKKLWIGMSSIFCTLVLVVFIVYLLPISIPEGNTKQNLTPTPLNITIPVIPGNSMSISVQITPETSTSK